MFFCPRRKKTHFAPYNQGGKLLIIQGVSEIRVLILTSGRTRQSMKLFSITFCKIRKIFFALQFLPNESFCVIN
jgi:hypothetical protein